MDIGTIQMAIAIAVGVIFLSGALLFVLTVVVMILATGGLTALGIQGGVSLILSDAIEDQDTVLLDWHCC